MNAHAKILKAHPSFVDLSSRILNRLTLHSETLEMPKGSVVYAEGDPGEAMYLVLSGRCQSALLLPDGTYQVLDLYAPGDTFGERALVGQDHYWTTVRVINDSVLLRLDGRDVHHLLDRTPRLARQLVNRLRVHMRSLHEEIDTLRAELGRVVTVSCLSARIHGTVVAENLSLALAKETGKRVLYVHVHPGEGHPRLADGPIAVASPHPPRDLDDHVLEGEGGLSHLNLFANGGAEECARVAGLIGTLARQYRYVVISVGTNVDPPVIHEFQRQADLSYLLFGQRPQDLYRTHLFIRELRDLLDEATSQIRPVVCLGADERCRPFKHLENRLGAPVHAVMHGIPRPTRPSDTHSHYLHQPTDRFSANIRYLAREIGRCRIGLALSSGGAKGFAHVGVLDVLERNGIHVDVVAGSSMGSYIAALAAYGLSAADIERLCLDMEGRLGILKVLDPVLPPRRGFIKGKKARRLLEQTIGDAHFSDMCLHLRVVTTDLETLERVVHDSGQVSPVVQASMAMPGVVVPKVLDGRTMVDGGASEPLPVNVLVEMGVEKIIAVNTIPSPEEMTECAITLREVSESTRGRHRMFARLGQYLNYFDEGNILDVFMRSMHAIQTRVAEGACKQADVVLRPVVCDGKWYDYGKPRQYLDLGRTVAEEKLPELLQLAGLGPGEVVGEVPDPVRADPEPVQSLTASKR